MENDKLYFREEGEEIDLASGKHSPWIILIVDDDPDVHETTVFTLGGSRILDKPLRFLHAYSGREAIDILRNNPDVALVLLDAVMESEEAGLSAVQAIREDLGMEDVRIILRTGQPGQIPELNTITQYDINDYKTKSELTHTKLVTALTAALRSWQQIQRIKKSRRGLETIVQASNSFIVEQGLESFAEGVITQMAGLFGVEPEGIVCASDGGDRDVQKHKEYVVIAAAGKYRSLINHSIHAADHEDIYDNIHTAMQRQQNVLNGDNATFYFSDSHGKNYAAWIDTDSTLDELDTELLGIFCTNLSLCASNIQLVNRLKQQVWEDPVFKIPNMAALLEAIREQIVECTQQRKALLVLDVDEFYKINDMLGHDYGDIILQSLIVRLRELFDASAYIARIGSDTFAVLCDETSLSREKLRLLTSMVIHPPGGERELSLSIGVTMVDSEVGGASTQLRNGFIAMKRAKGEGLGQVAHYSRRMGEETRESFRLLQQLKDAFAQDRLHLVFQPQVSLADKSVFSCEALLRWQKEDGQFVPPDRFIPLAEQAGLIVPMGAWVLRQALSALKRIHTAGFDRMRMAVNVSALQLRRDDFLGVVDAALEETGVAPHFLELEITESVSALGGEEVRDIFNGIRERGVSIAIDDFGTGYSSLSSIDRWPVDRLKIDRSFVSNMDKMQDGARLVDLVIPLGNRLSMQVLAEGVENEDQLRRLQELECHEVQGYFFSRPLGLEKFINWMKDYATS